MRFPLMDPGGGVPTEGEFSEMMKTLRGSDEKIAAFLKRQEEREKKTHEVIETTKAELIARINKQDEDLKKKDAWISDIEAKLTSTRFNNDGTDALRNALPDDLKAWIPRLKAIEAGEIYGMAGDGTVLRHGSAVARLVKADPVKAAAFGGWFQARIKAAIARASKGPAEVTKWNERAEALEKALGGFEPEAKAAMQEDTDSEGGYLVPTILEGMIGWLIKDNSVARSAGCTIVQMRSALHQLPSLANDFSVAWTDEEGTITDGVPAAPFSQGNLRAKKQTSLATVSIELIQDNVANLLSFVFQHLLTLVGRAEDLQVFEGDGTVFEGLFSVTGTVSISAGGNAAASGVAPTFSDLMDLIFGAEHQSTIDGGVIFAHPWFSKALLKATTGTAGAIYIPFIANRLPNPSSLVGVPYFPSSAISRIRSSAANESVAYHGNPAYIVIGDRMGTTFEANPWSETEWKKGQISLRLMRRVAVLIWVPGYFTKLVNFELA